MQPGSSNILSYENSCRICLDSITEDSGKNYIFEDICDMILSFTSINLIEEDGLPNFICNCCLEKLKRTVEFKNTIESSQNVLQQFLKDKYRVSATEETGVDIGPLECKIVNESDVESSSNDNLDTIEVSRECNVAVTKHNENNVKSRSKGQKTVKESIFCPTCNKSLPSAIALRKHKKTHGLLEKKLTCDDCGKKYTNQYDLIVHLRKHSGARPFSCNVCRKAFADQRCLEKHRKIHLDDKQFKCELCDKSFIHSYTLKTHLRIHSGEKPFVCAKCGYSFTTATHLKLHTRVHHTQEKPYKCSLCPKAFTSSSGLANHRMTHTGERKYICAICGKGSRTSSDLKCHLRTHTGERPFACIFPDCDRKYKTNSQLCTHLRTHTGEKNHQCAVCPKAFSGATQLKTHMRVHTGAKPYMCSMCNSKFSQSGSLKTHLKIHHKNVHSP